MTMTEAVEAGSASTSDTDTNTDTAAAAAAGEGTEGSVEEEGGAAATAETLGAGEDAVPTADDDAPAAEENTAPAAKGAACDNKSEHCVAWRQDGQCDTNPRFMAMQCAEACDLCEGSEGHAKLYPAAPGGKIAEAIERPESTLWGMMTGKTAKHLEGNQKLSSKLQKLAPMKKLDNAAKKNKAKTKKMEEKNKEEKKDKTEESDKGAKEEKKGNGKPETGAAAAARVYDKRVGR